MNKKLLRRLTGIVFCIFIFSTLHAQIPLAPANVQSPNVASLGLFGEIPVSYYTGIPDIGVPLYTLKEKGVSVPISLNYHASGFRPDMHPGWVGTGFALASGGVVTRVVKDWQDDYNNSNYFNQTGLGFYYNRSILNTPSWKDISYMENVASGDASVKDTEPDEFSFNFGDYHGSFYLNADGTWKVKCDKPLSIALNGPFLDIPFTPPPGTFMQINGMSKTFGGFIITTEDGTQYCFGGNTNAIEYSLDIFHQEYNEWHADSWYLVKIIPPLKDEINFSYERDDYINQMYISIVNDFGTRTKNSGGIANPQPSCGGGFAWSDVYSNYNGMLVAPVYLKQISSLNTVVKFNRSTSIELRYDQVVYDYQNIHWADIYPGLNFLPFLSRNGKTFPQCLDKLQWKKLDQIRVERTDGTLIKAFNFAYTNNASERLKLLSVTEQGSDLLSKPPYTFSYDESVALPGYLSNKVDHWGFYNGTYADISNMNNYYLTYYGYKEPVAANLYAGTLNEITYPTGGRTEFTYEPNYYSKRIQEVRSEGIDNTFHNNTLAGGLRIKKIVSYDPGNPLQKMEKDYFYVTDYSNTANLNNLYSSGVLGGQTKYYFNDYTRPSYNDKGVTYSMSLFSSQSVLPGSVNAQGSHIGYSEVTERLSDGSYTKYFYSNFDNGHLDGGPDAILQSSRTAYEPYSSKEEERGKLMDEINYNNQDKKVREHNIQYIALNKDNEYVPSLKANFAPVCSDVGDIIIEGTAYRLYTYPYLPSSETITDYDTQGNLTAAVSKQYNYDPDHRLLKDETITNSKGQSVKMEYKYSYDFNAGSTDFTTQMAALHMYTPAITQVKYINNVQTSLSHTTYSNVGNGQVINFVPTSVYTQTTTGSPEVSKALVDYDFFGNSLRIRKNTADMGTCYIWGYNLQYIIAEVKNAAKNQIAYQDCEEGITDGDEAYNDANLKFSNLSSGLFSTDCKSGHKSYKLIDPNHIETVYQLPIGTYVVSYWSKGSKLEFDEYHSTDDFIDGPPDQNGWSYHQVTLSASSLDYLDMYPPGGSMLVDDIRIYPVGAQMTTYTYDPLVGMTSSTDSKGEITTYEYDSFQRLINIKDKDGNVVKHTDYHYKGQ